MRRSFAALLTVAALAAATLAGTAAPASAISPGVAFSATDLPTWQTNGIVWAMAEANGVVYAGGTFTAIRPPGTTAGGAGTRSAVNFAAFDAYTGNPTSCNLSVTGTNATVRALDVAPDGRTLYVGGSFSAVNGVSASSIAAINLPDCTVKTSFQPGGVSATVRAIDATNDAVYFGGDFKFVRNTPRERLAAVTPTGALLPWAPSADLSVRALHVPAARNDVVIAGGDFTTMNGSDSKALAVLDQGSGNSVRTYPRYFIPRTSVVKSITSDANSFYIGNEGTGGGAFDGRARLNLGSLDQVWRDTCLGATQAVSVYQQKLYAAHHSHDCGSMGGFTDGSRIHLSAQDIDNPSPMLQWNPLTNDGQGEGIGPRTLAHTTTGSNDVLWVGGEFTTVNSKAQQSLSRFGPGPGTAGPGAPRFVSIESRAAGQNTIRWQTATDPDDSELTYSVYRNGSSTPLGTVSASSLWWNLPQASFTDTTAVPGTAYAYQVRANDPDGHVGPLSAQVRITTATAASIATAYPSVVRADGADTYWRLGDTFAAAPDSSPADRMGLPFGSPGTGAGAGAIPGDANTATTFDGTDDQIYAPQRIAAPQVYSAEAWFRTDSTTGGKILGFGNAMPRRVGTNPALSSSYDRHVYMTNEGNLVFGVWTGSAQALTSPAPYNDNAWHHVVAAQGAGGMTLYVDGVQVAANSVAGNEATTGSWRIGGDQIANNWPQMPSSRFFKGSIDEFAVYPTALSADRVLAHYTAGGGKIAPVPDTTAPSAVEGATASLSGTTANVGWTAATDNVGVTGYQVHRSGTEGFTPSAETLVASVSGTTLSYEDTGLIPGTYHYRILALDEAENRGPASAQATVTVPAEEVKPVTLTLTPSEDTSVNQGAPNTTYGSSVSLASRGNLGYTTYLRFLPGTQVPEGMTLRSATLRLTTTTDSIAGSVDQHTIHPVTGSWTEAAATWNNRPALATTLLGAVAPPNVNTAYTVDLDPAALAPMLAGPMDLGVTSTGTDNAWFFSREASANRRPVLTLVFTPQTTR